MDERDGFEEEVALPPRCTCRSLRHRMRLVFGRDTDEASSRRFPRVRRVTFTEEDEDRSWLIASATSRSVAHAAA